MKKSVLFVCLGNICRSPLAEAALRQEAAQRGLDLIVDSAGTGDWHLGQAPDERAQAVARRNGVDIGHFRARQVRADDFRDFDHVIALDKQNLADLAELAPANASAHMALLLDFVDGREGESVKDPYYGDAAGFDETWAEVCDGARGICAALTVTGD